MRVRKHLFVHNSVRKRARDKSRIPNERVDQAGHFGGLVIDIRPKMTEILMFYRKTLKKMTFSTFLRITPQVFSMSKPNGCQIKAKSLAKNSASQK